MKNTTTLKQKSIINYFNPNPLKCSTDASCSTLTNLPAISREDIQLAGAGSFAFDNNPSLQKEIRELVVVVDMPLEKMDNIVCTEISNNSVGASANNNVQPTPDTHPSPTLMPREGLVTVINKGTGAGGANTNYYGKLFEEKTNNQQRLIDLGYTKTDFTQNSKKTTKTSQKVYDYYLSKTYEDKTIVFVLQNGLKTYMKRKYNIDLFRCPDEAYIIEYTSGRKVIKILEKKEQNVEGSVETKLWSGPSLKREYELMLGPDFEVFYGFCVSGFLKRKLISTDKKYTILNTIFAENNIAVLFGDDENYFETFDAWVNNSV
jgi:hypothetical protein